MSERIAGKDGIARYFEDLLGKHGDHYLSLDWKSKESQSVRFAVLLEIISFCQKKDNISILDVGCGIAHFYDFLKEHRILDSNKIKYSGIDISSKMIDFAKKKHPGIDVAAVDLINDKYDRNFDYIFSSGAFNIRMADIKEHKRSVMQMLSRMYALAGQGVSVNFLAQAALYVMPENNVASDKYVYFSEEEVLSWVKAIAGKFLFRRDYHTGDFTVYMLK